MLEDEFKKVSKLLKKDLDEFEFKLLLQYLEKLKSIRILISESFSKAGIDGPLKAGETNWHFAEMNKYNRLTTLEKNIANEISELSGISQKQINSQLVDTYGLSYSSTFEAINKGLDISIQFQKIPRSTILEAIKNPFDRVGWDWRTEGHHLKSIDLVKSEITNGLIEGKGYLQTAANIKDKVNDLANNVARIVRSESHRVQQLGRLKSIKQSEKSAKKLGIVLKRKWVAIMDGKSKERMHDAMNGQIADEENKFTYPDGYKTELPGQSGIAHHDINCRCQLISSL